MKAITINDVEPILNDPTVHNFTKEIIRKGMTLDPVDAVADVRLALYALHAILEDVQKKAQVR